MSEDTPEKVEEKQAEEPAAKKKVTRKRSKTPEPKGQEDSKTTEKAGEEKAGPAPGADVSPVESQKPEVEDSPSAKETRPPLEDGETPTENPSIRRISSKRMKDSSPSEAEENSDQVATMAEPPAADSQGKKRRRRRRKGSGGDGDEGGPSEDGRQTSQRSATRVQLDPEQVTKKAWKIFLSEVSEEGLALVSDQDAKEIGRRSFRLAEIFLEESAKRQRD